jgi:MerR family transcriptional regulator/heat shock protein HspR
MNRQHHQAVYVISVAAELAGMHPQTLRIYERRGLLTPARTSGGNRRYSDADIARLRRIAELASSGMNLEGIRHVMSLEEEVVRLRHEVAELRQALMDAVNALENNSRGALVPLRQAVTLFGERPSIFHPHR